MKMRTERSLTYEQKHKKKSKPLDLQHRREYHEGAVFWSPQKRREACFRETVQERDEIEEKLQKSMCQEGV
jgi:hypothetical protein